MAKQGFQGIGTDLYSYYEITGSTASGLDNSDGDKYKIVASAAAGANPSGTAQFVIDPAADGNIDLTPNGAGEVNISKVDIDSGAIDGTTVGAAAASTGVFTQVDSDNLRLNNNTISSTDLNGDIVLQPDGTGDLKINDGVNDTFIMRDTGECTLPFQPCFGVYAANQANVTGDGTLYTITWTGGEYFDQGVNFATPTFTAPITGIYLFNVLITVDDLAATHTVGYINLVTTLRTYTVGYINVGGARDAADRYSYQETFMVDMTATNTAFVQICISNGALVVDIVGADTFFNGKLIC